MMDSRFSPPGRSGGAVRGLVIVLGLLALVWLGWIALLPKALQQGELLTFLGAAVVAGLIIGLVWLCQPRAKLKQTFWLSQDGESEGSGPYTVAQIVAMWKAGQITTRGMVMEEGGQHWVPIMAFAERFDESLSPPKEGFSLGRAFVLAVIILLILAVLFGER